VTSVPARTRAPVPHASALTHVTEAARAPAVTRASALTHVTEAARAPAVTRAFAVTHAGPARAGTPAWTHC
jgi:hypothetical protein